MWHSCTPLHIRGQGWCCDIQVCTVHDWWSTRDVDMTRKEKSPDLVRYLYKYLYLRGLLVFYCTRDVQE